MLDAALSAAEQLFSWGPIIGMLVVLPIALISGLMPGGGLPTTVVVLSMVGFLDPWIAITVVIFQLAASDITEPVPSILLGIPGSRAAQATVLDGYPMARQGLAGIALGASYTSQLIGGLFGALALLVSLPFARELLKLFGSPEFFLFSLLGLLAVAIVSAGAIVKGTLTAAFGLAIAMIGYSPIGGTVRASFGLEYLWDGLPLVPIVVGLFAIPEAIELVVGNKAVATKRLEALIREAQKDVYRGMRLALDHKFLMLKSSFIGTFVGVLPGLGGSAAHWIAYAFARQTEKGAKESFGKGDVRGVMAADAANNSVDGGELIPTVVFGIPGSGGMALLLTMFILYGIQPGPAMLSTHLDLTISFVYTIALANIIVIPIMLTCSPMIARISTVPPNVLAPCVIVITTLGAFQATQTMGDLITTAVFAVIGIFMKRYGWPRAPILLAVVLAKILEKYLWLSINTFGWSMFERPQFLGIILVTTAVVAGSYRLTRRITVASTRPGDTVDLEIHGENPPAAPASSGAAQIVGKASRLMTHESSARAEQIRKRALSLEFVGEGLLLAIVGGFFAYILVLSQAWDFGTALAPLIAVCIGIPFFVLRVVYLTRMWFGWHSKTISPAQIMDTGFSVGEDPVAERRRFREIIISIALLYLGVWLIGFHLSVPLWIFFYLRRYAKVSLRYAVAVALIMFGIVYGVYDYLINTTWNHPLILQFFY